AADSFVAFGSSLAADAPPVRRLEMIRSAKSRADRRVDRERAFHDRRYSGRAREQIDSYYSLFTAAAQYYEDTVRRECRGRRVLEYGCGEGKFAVQLSALGAAVHAIDISGVALEAARRSAAAQSMTVDFRLMDAEKLQFEPSTFDLICGRSILHPLDLEKAFSEIDRALRPDGKAVFLEPLGDNPALRLARTLTPQLRSIDEHPLRRGDIRFASRYFGLVELRHFHLASLLAAPFRRAPGAAA